MTGDYDLVNHGYVGIELEAPYGWMNEDGDTLVLFKDFDRTVRDIEYFSPKDAATYRTVRPALDWIIDMQDRYGVQPASAMGRFDLAKLAMGLVGNKSLRKTLARMLTANIFELIGETFESDAMRGLWGILDRHDCAGGHGRHRNVPERQA